MNTKTEYRIERVPRSNAPREITLTCAEYVRYVQEVMLSLFGLAELARLAGSPDVPWSGDNAAFYVIQSSGEKLSPLNRKLADRFENIHGEIALRLPKNEEIQISSEEVREFETAMADVCAFTNLLRYHDLSADEPDGLVASSVAHVGQIIESTAREGLMFMRARLQGGAR